MFSIVMVLIFANEVTSTTTSSEQMVVEALKASRLSKEEFYSVFDYGGHNTTVGTWKPPIPPKHERCLHCTISIHDNNKVPIPSNGDSNSIRFRSKKMSLKVADDDGDDAYGGEEDIAENDGEKNEGRKGLQSDKSRSTGAVTEKVPHNWFGQGNFLAPKFKIATGIEECDVCRYIIDKDEKRVHSKDMVEASLKRNTCSNVDPQYETMCKQYNKFLSECPSYVHNICHEDVGGSERLRSPCPTYLKCYYCLRINPLYCET